MQTVPSLEAGDFIEAGGHRTHYHEAGSGETVVFIHGSGPGVTAWANWRNALPVFSSVFTCSRRTCSVSVLARGLKARRTQGHVGRSLDRVPAC